MSNYTNFFPFSVFIFMDNCRLFMNENLIRNLELNTWFDPKMFNPYQCLNQSKTNGKKELFKNRDIGFVRSLFY